MDVKIDEKNLKDFNEKARQHLRTSLEKYAGDLIAESYRIEAAHKSTQNDPEITSSVVANADSLLRKGFGKLGKSKITMSLKVLASISSWLVGVFYNTTLLQNPEYMLKYILMVTAAILLTTFSVLKE